ncbi:hypothetical protein PIGHUM_01217 [Pigmentiphaga humi]|uniref:Transposase n=1 Tax=Pigmentiphaga humi TaxID=2478468 RepID=A0A3P4AYP1_9BURK|nr:Rpn family recombination-promoting nuclease/putative transposase [Pigmentiphaga humi]VCU69157.1 hypothetical protein PIGHUM_01217 [Pigmentiphaga humi]
MRHHDRHYRRLFGHPAIMRDLLAAILPPQWRGLIDLDTLEPLPADHLSAKQHVRHGDLLWKVCRTDGQQLHLLVLLEHQSSGDRIMAVRILSYAALSYETLLRRERRSTRQLLPALLPIVLYTGLKPWRAATDVAALIDPVPAALQPFQPAMRYVLADAGVLVRQGALPAGNLASLVLQLEHNQGIEQAARLLRELCTAIASHAGHEALRHVLGAWVRYIVLPRALPKDIPLPDTDDIAELAMTVAHSRDWTLRPRMEGREEGRREGQAQLLKRQLMKKFGILPPAVVQRLEQATEAQTEAWSLNFVDADTLDDVFR